jgi:glycosyltransferase involved in cell wall biosynthesis
MVASQHKVVVVMPAYNAAKTLRMTYAALPHDVVDLVILVDDGSRDQTKEIAKELNLQLFVHNRNYGYGANQKTCYREALKAGADIIVMVHPDYQYDPTLLPNIIQPIKDGKAHVVLGSRLLGAKPMEGGMPWWKYVGNKFLTGIENWVFGLSLAEYHTGYRAFDRCVLEQVNFDLNSDNFDFDQEIIAQIVELKMRIGEVAVPTRYFKEASSASFSQSVIYGLSTLRLIFNYWLHKTGLHKQKQFDSSNARYQSEADANPFTASDPVAQSMYSSSGSSQSLPSAPVELLSETRLHKLDCRLSGTEQA